MGRGRLRRGYSLEVIFEEDPDFCSHLDSLDGGVAIRFGIKDDTISLDSLLELEEYQVRFEDPADAEQVFRSLDGFIDVRNMDGCMVEWDEFSMDSNSSRMGEDDMGNVTEKDSLLDTSEPIPSSSNMESEKIPSGRRSRVSRRQIVQATWLGYNSSSDESLTNNDQDDIDNNNNTTCNTAPTRPQRRRSPTTRQKERQEKESERKSDNDGSAEPSSITSTTSSTKCISVVSTSGGVTITGPNLVTSVEDLIGNDRKDGGIRLKTPIQLHLRASPNSNPPNAIFGRVTETIDFMEKDTLDSYISTMTDENEANAYTFADPFEDTHSVASTTYESSSGSTSSTESNGSVCTVNSFSMQSEKSKPNGNEGKTGNSSNESSAGFSSINSNSGGGSKYKTNLKVELVSQLNKSQEGSPHPLSGVGTASPPHQELATSNQVTVSPSSHLYSVNSFQNFESPTPLSSKQSPHHQPLQRQHATLLNLTHHQPISSTDHERQSLSGEVKRVRALFELRNHSRSSVNGSGSSSNGSTCPSSPESTSRSNSARNGGGRTIATGGETSPSGSASGRVGLYSKNGRRARGSPPNQRSSGSPSKVQKTSCSNNTSPTQMTSIREGSPGPANQPYDYVDILVNENVVIEDSPDIYQSNRSRRNGSFDRDSVPSPPISNRRPLTMMNLSPGSGIPACSTSPSEGSLRRSQSMGTGISSLGSPSAYGCGILKQSSSKTNILAEELPAPDTVKNVRNVFENMLKMKGKSNHGSESSVDTAANIITSSSFSGAFSIVKKSLSYIKSNPTSKIYRSESMRDDFPSMNRRYGKPVLMSEQNSPAHSPGSSSSCIAGQIPSSSSPTLSSVAETVGGSSTCRNESRARCTAGDVVDGVGGRNRRSNSTSPTNKYTIERKTSEPAKFSPKINTGLSPSSVPSMLRSSCQVPLTEEDPSFSSNVSCTDDYRTRKYVHADVLQKIRSAGTTTTYFGGKIIAKTVKNRKLPVSRRHTFDFQDYVGINGDGATFPNYESYNPSNYCRDESAEKCLGTSASNGFPNYGRRDSRPALEIPLKSSSSGSIYASRSTISGALDSIFGGGVGGLLTFASKPIDTTPRIISVVHKSPPGSQAGSPVKSCSPVSSVIEEGRNSPEGCEASNERTMEQDGNNNNLPGKVESPSKLNCTEEGEGVNKKFSQVTEGAWF